MNFIEHYLDENEVWLDSVRKGVEKFNVPTNDVNGKMYLTLHHGTSEGNLKKILKSGKFKVNTYFAPDRETALRYAGMTGSKPITTIAVISADGLMFDGNYFYANKDLYFSNGVYK